MIINFFQWREFSNDKSQKMSTNVNSSHFHQISTTFSWRCEQLLTKKFDIISALLEKYAKYNWFNIVMKMWFRYFSLKHITITISSQCWENVFCPITKSSHFYHNAREMYLVNILGWKCDVEVKGAWNLLNHKSTLLW